jgi:hypothetical protein
MGNISRYTVLSTGQRVIFTSLYSLFVATQFIEVKLNREKGPRSEEIQPGYKCGGGGGRTLEISVIESTHWQDRVI